MMVQGIGLRKQSLWYLNKEFKNPYLIKFKEGHLSKEHYLQVINTLYSKENIL